MGIASDVVGPVTVTFAAGTTRTFPSAAEAKAATSGLVLTQRRGAWFEVAREAKPHGNAALPAATKKAEKATK